MRNEILEKKKESINQLLAIRIGNENLKRHYNLPSTTPYALSATPIPTLLMFTNANNQPSTHHGHRRPARSTADHQKPAGNTGAANMSGDWQLQTEKLPPLCLYIIF